MNPGKTDITVYRFPSAANLHRGQVESTSFWAKSSCVVPDRGAHLPAVVNVSLSIELVIGSLPFGRRFESADSSDATRHWFRDDMEMLLSESCFFMWKWMTGKCSSMNLGDDFPCTTILLDVL